MKKTLAAFALSLLAAGPAMADQQTALDAIRQQPRVVDAKVDTSGNMYVLVRGDKVSWTQVAQSFCSVVRPHQGRIFRIRLIDLIQANNSVPPASWRRLAEADCAR